MKAPTEPLTSKQESIKCQHMTKEKSAVLDETIKMIIYEVCQNKTFTSSGQMIPWITATSFTQNVILKNTSLELLFFFFFGTSVFMHVCVYACLYFSKVLHNQTYTKEVSLVRKHLQIKRNSKLGVEFYNVLLRTLSTHTHKITSYTDLQKQ